MDAASRGYDRFNRDAQRYAEYLETPDGRLRSDLTFANLQAALPERPRSLHALDLGCGTGSTSIRLARLGFHVAAIDSSPAMLQLMEQTVIESGVKDKVVLKCCDASRLDESLASRRFDVVVCHNVLEYVDDPESALRGVSRLMCDSSILSVLVRNQAGEVLKAALQAGDLTAAENNLTAEWGTESLYGGTVRFFTPETLETMLRNASLSVVARRGVRILSDFLPANISRMDEYQQIFALEYKLSMRAEFFGIARYLHYIVSSANSSV